MQLDTPLEFRPNPNYPTYPPYHKGLYLEDYFINFWLNNRPETERTFIPISWTSYYNNGLDRSKLQEYLNSLPRNKKYFVVSQHDDAPSEILPPDTLIFSAGGNVKGENVIPIPLICSKMEIGNLQKHKDIFCSFVGSKTHGIRNKLYSAYKDKYYFSLDEWSSTISNNKLENFINITGRSKFSLCPRGYGASSFRLYEVMQLGTIPVYVSDTHYLPWTDELDWNEFCVLINGSEIHNLHNVLTEIDDKKYQQITLKIKEIYNKYFTLDGVCVNIEKRIK